jgi:hypothetical protein
MGNHQHPIQFVDEIFKYIHISKPEFIMIKKDFAAIGFLSAYNGLLKTWEDVKAQAAELRNKGEGEFFDSMLSKNIAFIGEKYVDELIDYAQRAALDFRKEIYRRAAGKSKNAKISEFVTDSTSKSVPSLLLASMNFGVQLHQRFFENEIKKSANTKNHTEEIINKIDWKGLRDMQNEQEVQAEESEVVFERETSDNSFDTSSNEDSHDSLQTSDKQFDTSDEPVALIGKAFKTTKEYEYHDYANMLPMMSVEESTLLVEGSRSSGQFEPILLYNDKITDGRNRYEACKKIDIPVLATEWLGSEEELLLYIHEKNMNRRDLTSSQRAMSSYKLLKEAKRLAKLRQGTRTDLKISLEEIFNGAYPEAKRVRTKSNEKQRADAEVASKLKTNRTYVSYAGFIYENAPELMELVFKKELTITKANQLAKKLTKEERIEVLSQFRDEKRSIDAIVKSIKNKDDNLNDQPIIEEMIISSPYNVNLSEDDINQLETKYGIKVKVKMRRKPKEIND